MNIMNNIIAGNRQLSDRHGRPRTGAYMHTSSGQKYWPFDPRPDEVDIEVIAHQLAGQNRWQGAVQHPRDKRRIFYSVAEHSVLCANYVRYVLGRPDLALEALLHDASEAYIGDLIRPLKYDPVFREPFLRVEELNERAIAKRFNLAYPFAKEIKLADEAVCEAENRQIVVRDLTDEWTTGKLHNDKVCAPYEIGMLDPYTARQSFLIAFRELLAQRSQFRDVPAELLAA